MQLRIDSPHSGNVAFLLWCGRTILGGNTQKGTHYTLVTTQQEPPGTNRDGGGQLCRGV